jgi:hypothetical protein
MPEGTVKVDRSTKWGNPYVVAPTSTLDRGRVWLVRFIPPSGSGRVEGGGFQEKAKAADLAIAAFRERLKGGMLRFSIEDVRRELVGKNLGCWCAPGAPCHADVLLRVAAGGEP